MEGLGPVRVNIGALIVRTGLWGILWYCYGKEPSLQSFMKIYLFKKCGV